MGRELERGLRYRMPAHFGPTPGPRQGPDGQPFDWSTTPRRDIVSISFRTEAAALADILPAPLELVGEPIVTIEHTIMTELEWLAGRGYNMLGVKYPARFKGRRDDVVGSFLAVLWENLPDPILSGRDELGFNKLYCELPTPRILRDRRFYSASWLGHEFFTLEVGELRDAANSSPAPAGAAPRNDGTLHHKYIPKTGADGEADVSCIAFTPITGSRAVVKRASIGVARHEFRPSSWEQLPTMYHIVNTLAALPVVERSPALITETRGGKDLSDQRILT